MKSLLMNIPKLMLYSFLMVNISFVPFINQIKNDDINYSDVYVVNNESYEIGIEINEVEYENDELQKLTSSEKISVEEELISTNPYIINIKIEDINSSNEYAINNEEYGIHIENNIVDYEKENVLNMTLSEEVTWKEEIISQLKGINPNILSAEITLIND